MATRGGIVLKWDHWHIEPSSICTLRCPRCPRAEVPESLLNRSLTLNFFQSQIGADTVKQIKKITFCGNDGDPIYCKDFLDICSWIKQVNPDIQLVLITNGSHKPMDWWERLGKIFNANDEIHWSIDGWDQESNEQYRVNSNWLSIVNGINSFNQANTSTYKVWASAPDTDMTKADSARTTITVKNGVGTSHAQINPGIGKMQNGWYTVPANNSFFVTDINVFTGETKQGATPTWFYFRAITTNNITGITSTLLQTSFQNEYKVTRTQPFKYGEKTDIQWQFYSSDSGTHSISIILEGLLISNNL